MTDNLNVIPVIDYDYRTIGFVVGVGDAVSLRLATALALGTVMDELGVVSRQVNSATEIPGLLRDAGLTFVPYRSKFIAYTSDSFLRRD